MHFCTFKALSVGGITVTPDTAVTRWRGKRMDYGMAIDAMLFRTHRAAERRDVSAETSRAPMRGE
jgi:hypothetical protein